MTDPLHWNRLAQEGGKVGGQDTAATRLLSLEVLNAVRGAYPMNEVPGDVVAACGKLMEATVAFEDVLERLLGLVGWTHAPDCDHLVTYRAPAGSLRCVVCGRLEEKAPEEPGDLGGRPASRGDGPK